MPDLVIRGGNAYRIVSDQLGSPVLAINTANSSDIPLQATYSAFGERTLVVGTDDWMPFGFAGGHYDIGYETDAIWGERLLSDNWSMDKQGPDTVPKRSGQHLRVCPQ